MKNKGLTYVLLIVVALIWYNVFYRVSTNFFGGEESNFESTILSINKFELKRDTFSLNANYRDPFSHSAAVIVRERQLEIPKKIPERKNRFLPVDSWPQIRYYGLISKSGSKTPLGIIRIDGMLFYLRNGESVFKDLKIGRIYKDSILVFKGKDKKMVRINEQ